MFEKVRDNQDKYTLLESKIANGQDGQLVLTICSSFWAHDTGLLSGNGRIEGEDGFSDEDDNPNPKAALDKVDELMVRILDNLIDRNPTI